MFKRMQSVCICKRGLYACIAERPLTLDDRHSDRLLADPDRLRQTFRQTFEQTPEDSSRRIGEFGQNLPDRQMSAEEGWRRKK